MKNYLIGVFGFFLIGCTSDLFEGVADEIKVTKFRDVNNDTLNIRSLKQIREIISFINKSKESPVKMAYDYKLEFYFKDSINPIFISLKKNRFRFNGKSYISNINIQDYIDQFHKTE